MFEQRRMKKWKCWPGLEFSQTFCKEVPFDLWWKDSYQVQLLVRDQVSPRQCPDMPSCVGPQCSYLWEGFFIQFPICLPCVSRPIAIITLLGILLISFLLLPHLLLITFIFNLKGWNILRTISHHYTSTPFFSCHIR